MLHLFLTPDDSTILEESLKVTVNAHTNSIEQFLY